MRRSTLVLATLSVVLGMAAAPSLWADRGAPSGGGGGGGAVGGGGGGGDPSGRGGGGGGGPEAGGGDAGGGGAPDRGDRNGNGGMEDEACDGQAQADNDARAREDQSAEMFDGALGAANRDAAE